MIRLRKSYLFLLSNEYIILYRNKWNKIIFKSDTHKLDVYLYKKNQEQGRIYSQV